MTVLALRLTDLDASVLAVLDAGRGKRADRVADEDQRREVAEILRGLEATGYAACRGGWWRRA